MNWQELLTEAQGKIMTAQAHTVLRAAHLKHQIGRFAARRMAEKSGTGGGYLYRLACQLIAASK